MSTAAEDRVRPAAARALQALERRADHLFGSDANPLRQLGALAVLMLWTALASGIWMYIEFDASSAGAHASIADLSRDQPWGGGLVRSLHRYSADAFALFTALHVVREWLLGRYAGFRWFSWITGVPMLWLALGSGLVGYWLVGDTRALFVAAGIAEWTGWLPGFGDALMRTVNVEEAPSDRLNALLVFLHIALALLILAGLWLHLKRVARPFTQPQRRLAIGTGVALLALAIVRPALSMPPMQFSSLPLITPVDWFYIGPLALMHATSAATLWTLAGLATLLLVVLPWLSRAPRPAAAIVDLDHCNGCGRCFDDCPFGAVVLVPRSDGRRHAVQARVDADACAGCGICVGACPTATPFRSKQPFATGIDLPGRTLSALHEQLRASLDAQPGALVLFGCDEGADVTRLATPGIVALSLPCTAMLPPSFTEFALRRGAQRVVVAHCGAHACTYRLGGRWTVERLSGQRAPRLRAWARGPLVRQVHALRGDESLVRQALLPMASAAPAREAMGLPESHDA